MNGLPIEVIIILLGIGVVALLWLAMRFGRTIGIAVLVLGLLAVAILGAAALATQAGANFQASKATIEAVQAVKTTSSMMTIGLVLLVLLLAMVAGLIVVVAYLSIQRRNRPGLHAGNLDGVMNVAQITAISQLLMLQQEMADSLRHRGASPRRRRSPWRVSAPFLPRSDPSMMAAFQEADDSEEWESWPDEGGGGEGGRDLWGVN